MDYSKWDKIELSDDEDFDCHPNIDKKSFIRFKQQEIHKQREARREKISQFECEKKEYQVAKDKLHNLISTSAQADASSYIQTIKELMASPSGQINDAQMNGEKYFASVLRAVYDEGKMSKLNQDEAKKLLEKQLAEETKKLEDRLRDVTQKLDEEIKEQNKKLTSDNMYKEGFNKTVSTQSVLMYASLSCAKIISKPKKGETEQTSAAKNSKETTIEVLNAEGVELANQGPVSLYSCRNILKADTQQTA
jgi:cell division cycle protein 37